MAESEPKEDWQVRIARLSPEQRQLWELRRRRLPGARPAVGPLPRRAGPGPWPASIDQTGLWLFEQLHADGAAYNVCNALRWTGPLHLGVLERSLGELARRHEILRTTFRGIRGRPFMFLDAADRFDLTLIDLRPLPDELREQAAQDDLAGWIQKPFVLEQGPLWRVPVVRLGETDYLVPVVMHHLITDWWSYEIFFRELLALYGAFVQGRPAPATEPPVQFVECALWREEWCVSDAFEQQREYWRATLAGAPPALELRGDWPRPPVQSLRGGRVFFQVTAETQEGLRRVGSQAGATPFMVLLAAVYVLLYRYTGAEDLLVGSPVALRDLPETANVIGYLLNTVLLRARLHRDIAFAELLQQVKVTVIEVLAHKDLPFRYMVQELNPPRSLTRMPLLQVEFLYVSGPASSDQDQPARSTHGDGPQYHVSSASVDRKASPVDLQFAFKEGPDGLTFLIEYDADIFEPESIRSMGDALVAILEGLAQDPTQRIGTLPVLTPSERRRVLMDRNATQLAYPARSCVHELFREQATRQPEAVALVAGTETLTYRALDARANRLAHRLQTDYRVGPEVPVGVCLERSAELVVALLAVLKAGGAYLPLDPAYPPERLAFLARDAGLTLVLTQPGLRDRLPTGVAVLELDGRLPTGVAVLELDGRLAEESEPDPGPPVSGVGPENLAYVIYTSGSTGTPKGVMGVHRSVVNRLAGMSSAYPFAEDEVCCQNTSLSFVDSVLELFAPLVHGIPTIIAGEDDARNVARLADLVAQNGVTRIVAVPSLLEALVEVPEAARLLHRLRLCISSGESLPVETAVAWLAQVPGSALLNVYGSTEIAGDATSYRVQAEGLALPTPFSIPIGRPIANTQVYVLDGQFQAVPVGVAGELYIGGAGLARGYRDRPGLTAEKFVPDPWSREPGARLYRSGDRVRWRADGNLEFLGRVDQQVKLRGYRIEPGEIEAALRRQPGVADAAVILREESPRERRLVAYLVARAGNAPTGPELRVFLAQQLPEYMIPARFVFLDALPRSGNGKVDYRALPAPGPERPAGGEGYRAPGTPTEAALAGIWSEVLGVERVGIHDNFFELGGHSLLLIRVHGLVCETLGCELGVVDLFRYPTIAALATYLDRAEPGHPGMELAQQRARLRRAVSARRRQPEGA